MKRYLFIIILFVCAAVPTTAQYYSVNYDKRTVAEMTAAFASEAATEAYYAEQVAKIREYYQAAEVAAAGIFTSKFLDRRALTDLGLWTSSTENYYYRRIYNMVSAKIMPKIWTVAGMMLRSPQNALYWGSYLYKVCEETKTLCYQFESIVTNSRLSFRDIAFLEINQELAAILKLSELGDVDWKNLLDNFSDIGSNFTKDNLKADIDNLYAMGVSLASAGAGNAVSSIVGNSNFNGTLMDKTSREYIRPLQRPLHQCRQYPVAVCWWTGGHCKPFLFVELQYHSMDYRLCQGRHGTILYSAMVYLQC